MCGRFTLHHNTGAVASRFAAQTSPDLFAESLHHYNIAPTHPVAVVRAGQASGRILESFQWGLVPSWAKDRSIGSKLINARAETLTEKPSFRNAFRYRRCLVPADGFYEWDKVGGTRQPFHFRRRDNGLFAFAGLWEKWSGPSAGAGDTSLYTCTIITTTPNSLLAPIHDRMPVILLPEEEAAWLETPPGRASELLDLLLPYPAEEMMAVAVSKRVNSPVIDEPFLLDPYTATPSSSLFQSES